MLHIPTENGDASLSAEAYDATVAPLPMESVAIRWTFRSGSLTGTQHAWFDLASLRAFAAALDLLDREPHGSCCLTGMSPGALTLTASARAGGPLQLRVEMTYGRPGRSREPDRLVSTMETSQLHRLTSWLRRLSDPAHLEVLCASAWDDLWSTEG